MQHQFSRQLRSKNQKYENNSAQELVMATNPSMASIWPNEQKNLKYSNIFQFNNYQSH